MERIYATPIGQVPGARVLHIRTTELLVHGWDLATALGRLHSLLPSDLAEVEFAFSEVAVKQLPPGRSPFAPPVAVPASAPAVDRLAGLLGRAVDG